MMAPTAIPTATATDKSRLLIQQPVHDRGGVAHQPGSHVAIAVQRDADLGMTQQFLDHLGMLALRQQQRRGVCRRAWKVTEGNPARSRPPAGPATTRRAPEYQPHPPPRWNHTHQAIRRDGTDGGLGHRPPSGSGQLPHPSRPLPENGHRQSHARAILSRVQPDVSARPRLAPSPRYPQPGRHAPWPRQPVGHPDQRASGARARLPARSRPLPPPSGRPAPAAPCSAPAPARLAGTHRSCRCHGPP
jgi:hypothetical protein